MNPEQEIGLVLRVLSTQPADEEIFHLENEDVNPRQVEQEPEEKPEPEPEPEEEPEEEPVPLPVPVGGTLSSRASQLLPDFATCCNGHPLSRCLTMP